MRVATLLPSATDTVHALDCCSWVVARTHECDVSSVQQAPIVTSSKLGPVADLQEADILMATASCSFRNMAACSSPAMLLPLLSHGLSVYQVDIARLESLRPDVILTQVQDVVGEEGPLSPHGALGPANTHGTSASVPPSSHAASAGCSPGDTEGARPGPSSRRAHLVEQVLAAAWGYRPKVVHLAAGNMAQCWQDMLAIAAALNCPHKGRDLVHKLQRQMAWVGDACGGRARPTAVCIQWPDPWYAAGAWVPECMAVAGGREMLGSVQGSVAFTLQQLAATDAQVLVFALCGLSLQESMQHARAALQLLRQQCQQLPAVRNLRMAVVDGTRVLSRPGPLLVESMQVLQEILQPECQPYGHHGRLWHMLEA